LANRSIRSEKTDDEALTTGETGHSDSFGRVI
jgi:hypothetical protein